MSFEKQSEKESLKEINEKEGETNAIEQRDEQENIFEKLKIRVKKREKYQAGTRYFL